MITREQVEETIRTAVGEVTALPCTDISVVLPDEIEDPLWWRNRDYPDPVAFHAIDIMLSIYNIGRIRCQIPVYGFLDAQTLHTVRRATVDVLRNSLPRTTDDECHLIRLITEEFASLFQTRPDFEFHANANIEDNYHHDSKSIFVSMYFFSRNRRFGEFAIQRNFDISGPLARRAGVTNIVQYIARDLYRETLSHIEALAGGDRYYNSLGTRRSILRDYYNNNAHATWYDDYPNVESSSKSKTGNKRATDLLLSHCDEQQKSDWKKRKYIIVVGPITGNTYKIKPLSQINIDVLDNENRVLYKLCTTPDKESFDIPIADQILAQKTMIELREQEFLNIAIRH